MITVAVEHITSIGKYGGAIFKGRCTEGKSYRFVADQKVMPRSPVRGEIWEVNASKQEHPKYGLQYVAKTAVLKRPSGRLIINTIAASPLFPDIGVKNAGKLYERFGERLYDMLDAGDPEPFVKPLKSDHLASVLVYGWQELAIEAKVYKWLDRFGAPVWLARKIIDLYGSQAIEKLEENPYRLMAVTGWEVADGIAQNGVGLKIDDDRRLVAATDAVVYRRLTGDYEDRIGKHTWTEAKHFKGLVQRFLRCTDDVAKRAIELAIEEHAIVEIGGGIQGLGPASMEQFIAARLRTMADGLFQAGQISIRGEADDAFMESLFQGYQEQSGITLNTEQKSAVAMSLNSPASIICGGAGVGKTTVLRAICLGHDKLGGQIYMVALSGRAARRMNETTGRPAMTIASFINKIDKGEIVLKNTDATIAIDESSMVDLPTAYRLLRRLEPGCRLLFIGDPGQLPAISFGVVFHLLVEHKALPTVELVEVHRQAASTGIPHLSRAIRDGVPFSFHPQLANFAEKGCGVHFIDLGQDDAPRTLKEIMEKLGGFDQARILPPVKRGEVGILAINEMFRSPDPSAPGCYGVGEPVIWTQNDYEKDLMNGSLGKVAGATPDGLAIDWENGPQIIDDLKRLELAYAITVHKSQGSQFKRCVIPIFKNRLLDRTMLYTAVTRSEEQVILFGDRKALEQSIVDPPSTSLRETGLHFYL